MPRRPSDRSSMTELAHIETIVFLQSVDLFSFCKAEEVLRIAAISKERSFAAGEQIFRANDLADSIYCVVRGEVSLVGCPGGNGGNGGNGEVAADTADIADIADIAEQRLGPLSTFGVVEILSGRLRAGDASAATDTLLLTLSADDLFDLLANNIEIVKALFRYLIHELQESPGAEA